MTRVAIVGGGIGGLALAEALDRLSDAADPVDVIVFERSDRAGGNIRTERFDGYLCERGPNGFLDNAPATLALVGRLGLAPLVLSSNDAARRRFVFARGRLHEIPTSVTAFARSDLLSFRGKLRLLAEPFARGRVDPDESIHDFAARRIGREAAALLVDPMVSGIFAGDSRTLSLRACFPKMWEMETRYGSLVRAMFARRRARRRVAAAESALGAPAGRLTSFRGGMQDLVDALVRALGHRVRLGTSVVGIHERAELDAHHGIRTDTRSTRFVLTLEDAPPVDADAVILAGSAAQSSRLLQPVDARLARAIGGIATAPLAVVCLGFDAASRSQSGPVNAGGHNLIADGFGFLVPRGEGPRALGVLWDSSIYSGRAPHGRVLMRAMFGGAHDPEAVTLSDAELLLQARADLQHTMGLTDAPLFSLVVRHRVGIPQYTIGHQSRLDLIASLLHLHPGLFVAGHSYRGVSMNACIADADPLARRVLDALAARRYPAVESIGAAGGHRVCSVA
ncbi:MAG: protoporphyrinogen oxidase [Acidobacteria bacterium]|nr:protoporphyrinogen oxidase [Acidobacteriota bacterium]